MLLWEQDGLFSLFYRAFILISLLFCVQFYFGFYISVHRRVGSGLLTSCLPQFKYNRIIFESNERYVSFWKWASGPFSLILEVIAYLPPETYSFLEENAYFPHRSIMQLIFIDHLLYYFGYYDCYRNNILTES